MFFPKYKNKLMRTLLLILFLSVATFCYPQQEIILDSVHTSVNLTSVNVSDNFVLTITALTGTNDSIEVVAVLSNPYREILLFGVEQGDRQIYNMFVLSAGSLTSSSKSYSILNVGTTKYIARLKNSLKGGRKAVIRIERNSGVLSPLGRNLLLLNNIWTGLNTFSSNIITTGLTLAIDSVAVNTTTTADSYMILVNAANANDTIILHTPSVNGAIIIVKKIDASVNYVVVKGTIDGVTNDIFNTQYQSNNYIYRNGNWYKF
jgi:hypothetical protein